MRTVGYLAIAATVLAATLALASPAGATCFGDDCGGDPTTEPDPSVGVYLPHMGEVDGDWVAFQAGVPNGVGLSGWSTSPYVRVTINGYFVMHVPSRETIDYMPHSGLRFTVFLPVYPWPANREVCVYAINGFSDPVDTRLGCRSTFTWWL
jgi:hypothetical protein